MRKLIVPCSGIGKALGAVTREVLQYLPDSTNPHEYTTICLPLLMTDDEESKQTVLNSDVYTIDGCSKKCASVLVKHVGGKPVMEILTAKTLAEHRDHKPDTVLDVGEGGRLLAKDISEVIMNDRGEKNDI